MQGRFLALLPIAILNPVVLFVSDLDPHQSLSENMVNKALRVMGDDTKTEVCGHGFRTMACSSLIESGLWLRDAVERQMSYLERSFVRVGSIYKVVYLEGSRLISWMRIG